MIELVTEGMRTLRKVYQPDAFNLGANIGEAAGAGIAGHVHFHVVPRWGGDTNFMSTLGDTRFCRKNWTRPIAASMPRGMNHKDIYRYLLAQPIKGVSHKCYFQCE